MNYSRANLDQRLAVSMVFITNAGGEEVQTFLSEYGITPERIAQGKVLYDRVQVLYQTQKTEYAEQYDATKILNALWETADAQYVKHVKLARMAFEHDLASFSKLGLAGKRKSTLSGWLTQARQFYNNSLSDDELITKLGRYNLTKEKLQVVEAMIDQVETAYAQQKREEGEAQQATVDRDAAVDALDAWMSENMSVARIALEEKPQYLEKLGIKEVS